MTATLETRGPVSVLTGAGVKVHSYMAPAEGDLVCSDIIETSDLLIVVDAQLLLPYARAVREYAEGLGKPIDRVVVTHAHPDHFSGLEVFADLPIHAGPGTAYALGNFGKGIMDFKRQTLGQRGDEYASSLPLPSVVVAPGSQTVGGVELLFNPIANSEHNEMLTIEIPAEGIVIASDLVYHDVHPVIGDKNAQRVRMFDGWVSALEQLQAKDPAWIVPGHGIPCDASVIPGMIEYIRAGKQLFESGISEEEFRAGMLQRYQSLQGPDLIEYSLIFLYHSDW